MKSSCLVSRSSEQTRLRLSSLVEGLVGGKLDLIVLETEAEVIIVGEFENDGGLAVWL